LPVSETIVGAFNSARSLVGRSSDNIVGYRYTAVLDNRTTDYCRSLDGKVFRKDDPSVYSVWPPNHYRCRSTMSFILSTDATPFWETGQPKVFGSFNQFKNEVALTEQDPMMSEVIKILDEIKNEA
jgi:hypothetical protein